MPIIEFPSIDQADENGLVAIGGDLTIESLQLAYSQGIFPWPISDEYPLAWYSPPERGILCYEDLYLSKSLRKFLRNNSFVVKFNTAFEEVITECADIRNRQGQSGTWITPEMKKAYIRLHEVEMAFSVEIFEDDQLVGGLYGVNINNYVSGESMFFKRSNASKMAIVELMNYLHTKGIDWIDTQMVTPVLENLGAKNITRGDFIIKLHKSLSNENQHGLFSF